MCREQKKKPPPIVAISISLSHHIFSKMSSIQPVHVHFPALLEQPPIDRVRKVRLATAAPWPFFMYVRLSTKKTYAKRGLVYPKLAQSKGSGDRMHSPDLFWGSRRVSAVLSGPEPGVSVPRGMVHLSKVLVNLQDVPAPKPLFRFPPSPLPPFLLVCLGVKKKKNVNPSAHRLGVRFAARQGLIREPHIVDSEQDVAFRRSRRCQWVVLGARVVPALQLQARRWCRRVVGGQPIHAGDRRR